MHCIHCGTLLPEGAKFCTSCGQPVHPVSAEPVQEPTIEEAPADAAPAEEPVQEESASYTSPVNASEGYKAASAQLPPSYSNPNYSSQPKATYTAQMPTPTNGLAIGGFVCSLIFLPIGLGILTAIAGLILSIMGWNGTKKYPGNKGKGLAIAGTIISAVRIVLILIGLVALFAWMLRGAGHVGQELFSDWSNVWPYNNF